MIVALETLLPKSLPLRNAGPSVPTAVHERPDDTVFATYDQLWCPRMVSCQIVPGIRNLATQPDQQRQRTEQSPAFPGETVWISVVGHRDTVRFGREVSGARFQMAEYLANQCGLKDLSIVLNVFRCATPYIVAHVWSVRLRTAFSYSGAGGPAGQSVPGTADRGV